MKRLSQKSLPASKRRRGYFRNSIKPETFSPFEKWDEGGYDSFSGRLNFSERLKR
jgi:hypothetical protein